MGLIKYLYKKGSIKRVILDIKDDIKKVISKKCKEQFDVLWYGAYEIDPKNLVYWICVETDKTKNDLENNIALNTTLRSLLEKHKYSEEAQGFVYISFASQETVDREWKGNWHDFFK